MHDGWMIFPEANSATALMQSPNGPRATLEWLRPLAQAGYRITVQRVEVQIGPT
jgi:hypothetical protein